MSRNQLLYRCVETGAAFGHVFDPRPEGESSAANRSAAFHSFAPKLSTWCKACSQSIPEKFKWFDHARSMDQGFGSVLTCFICFILPLVFESSKTLLCPGIIHVKRSNTHHTLYTLPFHVFSRPSPHRRVLRHADEDLGYDVKWRLFREEKEATDFIGR